MEKSGRKFYGIGIVSILMVFVVLCFTTFGVLSLVSARADMRLSRKNADNVSYYYAADAAAKKALAGAAEKIAGGAPAEKSDFTSDVMSCESFSDGGKKVTFTVLIGGGSGNVAHTELRVSASYDGASGRFVMTEHRVVALEPDGSYSSQGTGLFDMGGGSEQ